jgi:hypothetical protein
MEQSAGMFKGRVRKRQCEKRSGEPIQNTSERLDGFGSLAMTRAKTRFAIHPLPGRALLPLSAPPAIASRVHKGVTHAAKRNFPV